MRKLLCCLSGILLAILPMFAETASASNQTKGDDRLRNSGTVLREILDVPDYIPRDLLDKADCVVVFPSVLKATSKGGGSYGRGAMSCRQGDGFKGPWGAPTMMALDGGSFGYQIGGEATDLVLLVMNECGVKASSIAKSSWERMLPWLRARLVAIRRLGQTRLCEPKFRVTQERVGCLPESHLQAPRSRPDNGDNRRLYGRKIPARDIALSGTVGVPAAAGELVSTLDTKTLKHRA